MILRLARKGLDLLARRRGTRILVLDPEAGRIASDLARYGLDCWATADYGEALRMAGTMGEIAGLLISSPSPDEMATRVEEFRRRRPNLPVVSAYQDRLESNGASGVATVLARPCEPSALAAVIWDAVLAER